jgi:hypothetical protein
MGVAGFRELGRVPLSRRDLICGLERSLRFAGQPKAAVPTSTSFSLFSLNIVFPGLRYSRTLSDARAKNLRWAPRTKACGATRNISGDALLGWGMTFVTLSLRYARPRIGVGSEFFVRSFGALPKRFLKEKSSANRR